MTDESIKRTVTFQTMIEAIRFKLYGLQIMNVEPLAIILGPDEYIQTKFEMEFTAPGIGPLPSAVDHWTELHELMGYPVRVSTEPGISFEISPKEVTRFCCGGHKK